MINSIRVKWSEPLKESLVDASRFIVGGQRATSTTMAAGFKETVWVTFEDIPTSSSLLTIMPGAVSDITEFPSELKEIMPVDKLGPRLTVSTDTAITNGLLTIKVTTIETLTTAPTVTINGVTFGSAQPVETNEWSIVVDGTTFTGSAIGDGVKNVQAAGFDISLNITRGGLAVEAAGYPTGAVQFHLDTVIKSPVVVPADREVAIVSRPLITASYPQEIGEYSGDNHAGVTIISAKLDGVDVTSEFNAESASTWTFRPASNLVNKEHTLEVVGRDDAGNTHSPVVRVFSVLAPLPTATPVPTETPTPAPTVELPATVEVAPTEIPSGSAESPTATPEPVEQPGETEPTATLVEPEPTAEATPEVTPTAEPVPTPESTPVPEIVEPTPVPEASAPEVETPDAVAPEDSAPAEEPAEEPATEPEAVPTPTESEDPPEDTETPPDADSEDSAEDAAEPAEEPAADEPSAEVREDEANLTDDDLAATVAAMRAGDDDDEVTEEGDPSLAPKPALTVFGCSVPTGPDGEEAVGAVVAGADHLIAVAGLFGLIVARVRPRRRKRTE